MAVLLAQTREEIRASVGYNLGAIYLSTMTGSGSTTTGVDSTLAGGDDIYNGRWVVFTSGDNDSGIRRVNDYVGSTTTWTIRGDAVTATADGDTYELWDEDVDPVAIHDFVNRAIRSVPRKAAPPLTNYAIHTGGNLRAFDLSSSLVGVQRVYWRSSHTGKTLLTCDVVFDELVDGDVTAVLDDEDLREGSGSNRFQLAAGLGTGDIIASDSISSTDLSGYTHVEFWMKSTVATSAGNLVLRLSASASGGASTDDISVPALTANAWTHCRVALGNPHLDTAIISIALRNATDIGAGYVWLDGVRVVRADTEVWGEINRDQWWVDRDQRQLVLSELAKDQIGYTRLKLVGVQKPTELDADSTSCDVEPEYIISFATALAYRYSGDRRAGSREAAHQEADRWEVKAQQSLVRIQTPQGVRWIDD